MKPALVLLHGALGSKAQFQTIAPLLKDSFEIHLLNFEGHGGQPIEREYAIAHFTENLQDYLRTQALETANVFGYSMGGYVALNLAREKPQSIGKIMTLGTKFEWTPQSAAREVKMLDPERMVEKVPHFAQMLEQRHQPASWQKVVKNTATMMLQLGHGNALSPKDFQTVSSPALLCLGSNDTMVSEQETQNIVEALPQGQFHAFAGFKHPIESVDPAILADKIKAFFQP